MRIDPERWYALSPRWRWLLWSVSSGLMLLCATGMQWRMQAQQIATAQARHVRDAEIAARLWRTVRQLVPSDPSPSPVASRPFTPLEFDTGEMRMVRWQPGRSGGELVLEATWEQIPALFDTLAQRDMAVGHFSIQPEEKSLRITLQLEHHDAG